MRNGENVINYSELIEIDEEINIQKYENIYIYIFTFILNNYLIKKCNA